MRWVGSFASASDSNNVVFTGSSNRVLNRIGIKKWIRSDSSDSDSVELMPNPLRSLSTFRFSPGHKRSYGSVSDSDSVAAVAIENQPYIFNSVL